MEEEVLKCDFMVKRAQLKAKLLRADNYKGRWFKLTKHWLYYCDGKLEVVLHIAFNSWLLPQKHLCVFYTTLNKLLTILQFFSNC